ncbi:glycoside hydrolase N-terminal domain-containing protein [Streptomyces sp. NBC_00154]|uniref:glycosyl hydrolase family 95 catalytic domain-containing protein n=1 Tax=Streptomyces sp. NBC_00154 TaxID=2975670 RepID=UPI0022596E9D|nr:glycoside hydrolase N-terminal domain-containing protein [Streptomyces sp. NBC_00154]MCX5316734.1 glycoside hydrolase family 95 protein [Streptomyces sp. NBC_00154]
MNDQHPHTPAQPSTSTSRRRVLSLAATVGSLTALGGLPAFAATAPPKRPTTSPMLAEGQGSTTRMWYRAPAGEKTMLERALPVGNGRLGALVGNDPSHELLFVSDATMWTGGINDVLEQDGQFPYGRADFGSLTQLAHVTVDIPEHDLGTVNTYRRDLDLAQGLVTSSYIRSGVSFERRVFASQPDDVIVVQFSQRGGGHYTGTVSLDGTHDETTSADGAHDSLSFGAEFTNGLRYGAAVTAHSTSGSVTTQGSKIVFTRCADLTVVISGGTNYSPDPKAGYRDPGLDPAALARTKVRTAVRHSPTELLHTHVADYRDQFDGMQISLGPSTAEQRALDTWERLKARTQQDEPDPEFEALYLQFGRYLMISSSRGGLPVALQGPWLDGNDPDWMGDYHTDINIQMNYWMADRTALSRNFDAFTDYCLSQLPVWTELTQSLFNDPRNRFRNSSGKIAGWTVAFSTNIYGGLGWWWHPSGSAWLCNTLWEHYEYTQDRQHLAKIYPLLHGACEFWETRLLTMTVTDADTGKEREVLVADKDWSPEHGPQDAKGITYAQEVVRDLFAHYREASALLGRNAAYSKTVAGLQERLYMPEVSPKTGWLQEWMSPDNLGETTHRHLSPLVGLFPGDRIRPDASPAALVKGATELLTARGMENFGWANAWRSLCWARLKHAENAYQLVITNLRPSVDGSNGSAMNLFDIYETGKGRGIFQIESNFGTPAAMIEMLLYSRPGHIELLPALPAAWARSGSVTGIGARSGFVVDLSWRDGRVREATIHSVGGRRTTVTAGGISHDVDLRAGESVTLRNFR